MDLSGQFLEQIQELFNLNGWENLLIVELVSQSNDTPVAAVKLAANHGTAPLDLVNEYTFGVHPLEQIQQECLRALRTGRPGI